jgi:5-methyltetrahydropteroyltriglutamate--homocysteine methyltransferase
LQTASPTSTLFSRLSIVAPADDPEIPGGELFEARQSPPFRADHVGSLLRPRRVLDARERAARKEIGAGELRSIEDEAIREVVKKQEAIGLHSVTDGEFRRTSFHLDFLQKLRGVVVSGAMATRFHRKDCELDARPPRISVQGKLQHVEDIQSDDFTYLASVASVTPKVTIPSPTMVLRSGREAIDAGAYPDLEQCLDDLAQCYRDEIAALYARGCRYLQLDDTNLAYLCDPQLRMQAHDRGQNPQELPHAYAALINAVIDGRPSDLMVAIHLCRGNFKSAWVGEGGYEPVADVLFNELNVDAYFLEYDDERSGDFAPLRFVPPGKTVVLGLVSSKMAALEPQRDLAHRIDDASRYVPLDQLCLSPQCGFASTVHGSNTISEGDQWAKLELVVNTSRLVWSGVEV